jgi:hypothetical protein
VLLVLTMPEAPACRTSGVLAAVDGRPPGLSLDNSYGTLWFDCPGGRLCVVKAGTFSGDRRQQIATQLAGLVQSRLR